MVKEPFSLEAVILGRNDDYEPNWNDKLIASIAYNRARFEQGPVDYQVVFIEWNPPRHKLLLSPSLTEKFPFLRAIVVDAAVHEELSMSSDLHIMLNFGVNCGLRTSMADYCLICGGDMFIGTTLASYIKHIGLIRNCLYRAERVNIRDDLDFASATPAVIEAAVNIVSVDICTEPPYDVPPYTSACGDFILVDRPTMVGLRGFDESVRFARLHLDSRFCRVAMTGGLHCNLIGQIFHINHAKSYSNIGSSGYEKMTYDDGAGLPYLNGDDWGLWDFVWKQESDRLFLVTPERSASANPIQRAALLSAGELAHVRAVRKRLEETKAAKPRQPSPWRPRHPSQASAWRQDLAGLKAEEHWAPAEVTRDPDVLVSTGPAAWSSAAELPIIVPQALFSNHFLWLRVQCDIAVGAVGIAVLADSEMIHEHIANVGPCDQFIPILLGTSEERISLLIRNGPLASRSTVRVVSVDLVAEPHAIHVRRREDR
jgi:hypothetical protein